MGISMRELLASTVDLLVFHLELELELDLLAQRGNKIMRITQC